MIEFKGLQAQYQRLQPELQTAIHGVLEHGVYIQGCEVKSLENTLADFIGVKHCITCANGTDALYMILKYLGIGPGDGVIVPSFTFFATGEVVAQLGATPIFADIAEDTYNIDCSKLEHVIAAVNAESKITLKAMIAVDLFGKPADYLALEKLCNTYEISLVEDAAQSFGASYRGRRCGGFGIAAATSFFPAKPLGCYGDGGAIFTNSDSLCDFVRSFQCHGRGEDKYHNSIVGINSRLDEIQAAILSVKHKAFTQYEMLQLAYLSEQYKANLPRSISTPKKSMEESPIYAQYTIQVKDHRERSRVIASLEKRQIPYAIYYPLPLHRQKAFVPFPVFCDLSVSEKICSRVLSLPFHPYLSSNMISTVVDAVQEGLI